MRAWLERNNMGWSDLAVWIIGTTIALVWAAPLSWMVSTSFKIPSDVMTASIEWIPQRVTIDNYVKIFEYPIVRWFLNSLVQAVAPTTLCVLFGALAGFSLAQFRYPGRAGIPCLDHDPG